MSHITNKSLHLYMLLTLITVTLPNTWKDNMAKNPACIETRMFKMVSDDSWKSSKESDKKFKAEKWV